MGEPALRLPTYDDVLNVVETSRSGQRRELSPGSP